MANNIWPNITHIDENSPLLDKMLLLIICMMIIFFILML